MRGAPHVGFSATILKIRSRTSLLKLGDLVLANNGLVSSPPCSTMVAAFT